jgi:hypothetical protein
MTLRIRLDNVKKWLLPAATGSALLVSVGLQPAYAANPTITVSNGDDSIGLSGRYFTPGGVVDVYYYRNGTWPPVLAIHHDKASTCTLGQLLLGCNPGQFLDHFDGAANCDSHPYTVWAYDESTKLTSNTVANVVPGCFIPT